MAPSPETERVILAHQATVRRVRDQVARFVQAQWIGLGEYRDADIDRLVAAVLPVVEGGQLTIANLTTAYLAAVAETIVGSPTRTPTTRPRDMSVEAVRGVPGSEVYRRPALSLYWALSKGATFEEAKAAGLRRLLSLSDTDLQLAKTHTARRVASSDRRIVGYRRKLTGSENCGICHVAATQRYHKAELMPIHPGCDCDVLPIYGTEDPGQVIDEAGLEEAHTAIEDRFGARASDGRRIDYRKILLVREHGELGPVLTVKGQHFTGPDAI